MVMSARLSLAIYVEELVAELAAVSCPLERDQITRELHEAVDLLHTLAVPGVIPPVEDTP